ncbi:UvrD-helicase domain-containing protein [Pseudomonas benzenivorans]|uniref:DNA 3'-5' helicase n=1 Tax=Pseudomonas benzenivorans TaxID=556533 RepID=A0ABY5H878_9PSED|nr:UvrD-helicase domain-containing protein [Pseudomonas benzenivorans]UTW08006.1 UvrD-helicase domain-containing protein [Pseudomonas benzenivorans]
MIHTLRSTIWGGLWARGRKFLAIMDEERLKVRMRDGSTSEWDLIDIGSITVNEGLIWSSLLVKTLEGTKITLGGADPSHVRAWSKRFQDAHTLRLAGVASSVQQDFGRWLEHVVEQFPRKWHSNWLPRLHLKEASPPRASTGHEYDQIASHPAIAAAAASHPLLLPRLLPTAEAAFLQKLAPLNQTFLEAEVKRPLFDTLESSPLTDEQRQGVVCFDHRLMLVAAAGSGKTATMVAKAAYAIESGLVEPHEILMLAFNSAAAEELRERLDKRLAHMPGYEKVVSWTFHKFGLDVIGQAAGEKPRPASWLEGGKDVEKVLSIMRSLSESAPQFHANLTLLRAVFGKPLAKFGVKEPAPTFEDDPTSRGFRTLNGEVVKSQEELLIANWLFFHGVRYQYEPRYKHNTATRGKTQYHPDFYYPDIDLYHEHFALDQHGNPPEHFKDYAAGVKWKRVLHAEKKTEMFETTSHTLRSGQGLLDLAEALTSRGVTLKPRREEDLVDFPMMETDAVASILRSLMQHAKSNQLSVERLRVNARQQDALRGPLFVDIYEMVLEQWENELRETKTVDFDDMINLAIRYTEEGAYQSPYKLVIADEYQDSSFARARLLRAVVKEPDVYLCVVGDDWQSINRFAGADIGVMRKFSYFFDGGTIKYLSRTFRCPQQICTVSSSFVQANPMQLPKEVETTSTVEGKAIQCFAAKRLDEIPGLVERDIGRIVNKMAAHWKGKVLPTIMVLGRYRSDRPENWGMLQAMCKGVVDLLYATVHSSKGAEADYVLLVNVIKGVKGFPSEIQDDPILQIAMPEPEAYPFAEERRLFYVALTRAKRGVFIYTVAGRPSIFLTELQQTGAISIQDASGETLELIPCPKCGAGMKTQRNSQYGPFYGCSLYPKCDWKENIERLHLV